MDIDILFVFLIFTLITTSASATIRKISLTHNPGCDIPQCDSTKNSTVHIFYAKAQGPNDSLHYILSTVGPSPPTILLLKTRDPDTTLKINWTRFLDSSSDNLSGAVKLVTMVGEKEVKSQLENVIIFDRVLEYNDSLDTVSINASAQFNPILLKELVWDAEVSAKPLFTSLVGSTDTKPKSFNMNSSVSLTFQPFGSDGQSEELPCLPHNANSSDWGFILDNLISRGNGSRFSVELLLIGRTSNISKSTIKSIDDEYSPAVFTTERMEWIQKDRNAKSLIQTFSQWRAVSYTDENHQRKFSTDVMTSSLRELNTSSSQYSEGVKENRLLRAYFETSALDSLRVSSSVISFGLPQDGFYRATNYLSWTSTIGYGDPPADSFSTLVICMLFAGVGCPFLVILVGGAYLLYHKRRRSKGLSIRNRIVADYDYQPIQ